jgi:hypothetical protein
MLSKEYIEYLSKILKAEEKQMREQIIHLDGQLLYNQKIQKILLDSVHEETANIEAQTFLKKNKNK